MSTSIRIKLNKPNVRKVARSPEMQAIINDITDEIAEGAGGEEAGFIVSKRTGRNRARAVVIASTREAVQAEAKHRVLSRSIQAARSRSR